MRKGNRAGIPADLLIFSAVMAAAVLLSLLLAGVNDDNNPFAMAIFLLAVVVVARATRGYVWGIAASLVGTFCVNYIFTYPFWTFDISYPGYPLTFTVMLIVSVIVSALTTRIKRQEQLRFEAESEKLRANLLRAIAHDLRTPLASILGASSALRERQLPEDTRRALLTGISRDAEWLVRMTENLLSVTRVTGGDVNLKKEDEVLEEIIGSAIVKYRRGRDALPVEADIPGEIAVVSVNAVLIEQVFLNLFENVSAHGEGADRIWVHLTVAGGRVTVSVEDNGCGFPEDVLPTLLDGPVRQTASRRPDGGRNLGIGLTLCRSILHAHGSRLTAGRSAHGGAALRFDLQCKEEDNCSGLMP